ncbi:helix-turn-helix domain-containing protein [Olleya sp. HaHaR_3_96]|uniref:helix-turn-helix domain-containing protein n=1 Tax=Olleya sp. HaHaR_3_96 TaxID=2745560 RepID=UPI001C4EFD95|nr:helix-turn-helix domain-containing protein [Olleya sp. HaHaR_3_96]QXP58433.1 helix-turn-helix domain-containing protein [Olleya sp. HaHaR_3_96]
MMQKESPVVLIQLDKLQSLFNPVINKLEEIETKLIKKQQASKGYYRNKELKEFFGISSNTIVKYRESGDIPFTMMGDIYLYPISKINELLTKNANY